MNKIKNLINQNLFYLSLIILSSLIFTFYSGYKGIFPIDSFLIFDAGFKVLNDYHPFRDYWSITGPFLDYIQFLFFKVLGVSWKTYVFHAAIINILLSVITFFFFYKIGLKKIHSFIYAISISILGYPSAGTPFMDHHATIFSLFALMSLILAFKNNNSFYWFSVPVLLGFSFFSKQIPSVYLGFLFITVITVYLTITKFKKIQSIVYLLCGISFLILICGLIIFVNAIPIKNFIIQYVLYPMSIGEERSANLNFNYKNIFSQFKFIYFSLLLLIIPSYHLFSLKRKKLKDLINILILFTFLLSIFIFLYAQLMTKNQILIFFLIPFCLGISHYYIVNYFDSKKLFYLIIFIMIVATSKFHLRFNVEKKFMELSEVDFNLTQGGEILDSKLSGIKWITPNYPNNPKKELFLLQDTKDKIIKEKKIKIIVSDYQILPSITKTVKFAPNKWFDDLSVPNEDNKYSKVYKNFFENKLNEHNIQVIFIVGKSKINYILRHFPNKDCFVKNILNEIVIKINIEKCNFDN